MGWSCEGAREGVGVGDIILRWVYLMVLGRDREDREGKRNGRCEGLMGVMEIERWLSGIIACLIIPPYHFYHLSSRPPGLPSIFTPTHPTTTKQASLTSHLRTTSLHPLLFFIHPTLLQNTSPTHHNGVLASRDTALEGMSPTRLDGWR